MIKLDVALRLGRVSNLPTVWSNALAGMVLAGGTIGTTYLMVGLALSSFYVAGMWLNDAFDAEIDKTIAPDRPIPAGEISRTFVFVGGVVFLIIGLGISAPLGAGPLIAGLALAVSVVLYDWAHKKTSLAPVIMGITRFLCYVVAALAVADRFDVVLLPALGLFAYIVGLTYAAKQEAFDRLERGWPLAVLAVPFLIVLWSGIGLGLVAVLAVAFAVAVLVAMRFLFRRNKGDIKRAVILMIASISLLDAVWIAGAGQPMLALVAVLFFFTTLGLQRVASGT